MEEFGRSHAEAQTKMNAGSNFLPRYSTSCASPLTSYYGELNQPLDNCRLILGWDGVKEKQFQIQSTHQVSSISPFNCAINTLKKE